MRQTSRGRGRDSNEHTRIVRNEEPDVGIIQNSRDADKTSTASGHNSYILPRVLACLALAVHLVVELGNSFPQRLDTCCRPILSATDTNIEVGGARERSFDIIVDLRSDEGELVICVLTNDPLPTGFKAQGTRENVPREHLDRDWPTLVAHPGSHTLLLDPCTKQRRSTLLWHLSRHGAGVPRGQPEIGDGSWSWPLAHCSQCVLAVTKAEHNATYHCG